MADSLTHATVENEGCNLHYWYTGTGPLITFIPGGNGHSRQYYPLMTVLADKYTCVAFDRRQMSASQVKVNKLLSPPQQARDALAVMKAMGFEKSIFFGSSSGGIFGFQLAIDHPEAVDHLICHEAPTSTLLPDGTARFEDLLRFFEIYKESGIRAAAEEFGKGFKGFGEEGVPLTVAAEKENEINFWENEYLVLLGYSPDLRRIVENGTSVGVMAGRRSADAWYCRTTIEQEKILGCLRMVVPGHHQGFQVETEAFAPAMLEMLDTLEKRKKSIK